MTISLNWLKEYLDIDLTPAKISELLTSIGLEVESMEEIESIKGGLEGVVVGQVKNLSATS
jgi:phenylalanyl-tRNA synthetase beta chain